MPRTPVGLTMALMRADALLTRYRRTGRVADLDAACEYGLDLVRRPDLERAPRELVAQVFVSVSGLLRARYALDEAPERVPRRIEIAERGLELAPVGGPQRLALLDLLGHALSDRSQHTGSVADMRRAARLYALSLRETPAGDEDHADRLNFLGAAHRDLYLRSRDLTELETAIEVFERAVAAGGGSPLARNNLAAALRDRHSHSGGGSPGDLDRAVRLLEQVVAEAPADPEIGRFHMDLAVALLERFERDRRPEDLARAIDRGERGLPLAPEGTGVWLGLASVLGRSMLKRFEHAGDPADLDRAVDWHERMAAAAPPGSAVAGNALAELTQDLAARWLHTRERADLDRLAGAADRAADRLPAASPNRTMVAGYQALVAATRALQDRDGAAAGDVIARYESTLDSSVLAELYLLRGSRDGRRADLQRALELAGAEPGDSGMVTLSARCHLELMRLDRETGHLTEVLDLLERLADGTGTESDEVARLDDALGTALVGLAQDPAAPATAADAVRALAARLDGRPLTARYARLIGEVQYARHQLDGEPGHLRFATEVLAAALAGAEPGSPDRADLLDRLSARFREWYLAEGDPGHLRACLDYGRQAVRAAAPDTVRWAIAESNLAAALHASFHHSGDLTELDRAVAGYRRCLSSPVTLASHNLATVHGNLANALRSRHLLTLDTGDLDAAIEHHERAVTDAASGAAERANRRRNLGNAYLTRYQTRPDGDPGDLDRALEAHLAAVRDSAAGSPARPYHLEAVGTDHLLRFARTGDAADLAEAADWCARAVAAATPGTAAWAEAQISLARVLAERHDRAGDPADRARAVELYRAGCAPGQPLATQVKLNGLSAWAAWARDRGAWAEAVEPYRLALRLTEDVLAAQVYRRHRATVLADVRGIAADAAYALAEAGETAEAVLALERNRAAALSEALELARLDIGALVEAGHGALAERFQDATDRWLSASLTDPDAGGADVAPEALALAARTARADLDAAVDQIRVAAGRPDFRRPARFEEVAAAAGDQPLVYLAASRAGGIALVVADGGRRLERLPLPELTWSAVNAWWLEGVAGAYQRPGGPRPSWWRWLERVGEQLGRAVLAPLLDFLSGDSAVIVPVGYLELLPLAAAWVPDRAQPGGRRYAIDALTLSYAPNARVLRLARARAAGHRSTTLLAVEDPQPVTAAPLPAAAAEVGAIAAGFAVPMVLRHRAATRLAVLRLLEFHDVAHFACHGRVDARQPLDSALLLAGDQPLTLRDLLDLRLPAGPRLAVLSACETSMFDLRAPDEPVSLATGLLQAGIAGVIASHWRVPDLSTALLMIRFYDTWQRTHDTPAAALRAAQRWLKDTTNAEKTAYLAEDTTGLPTQATRPLWRAVVRLPPEARGFAHPAHWAGFTLTGA